MSSWRQIEAEKAFSAAARARRRASLARRLRGCAAACGRLAVHDQGALRPASAPAGLGLREIPLEAIKATVEPNRASHFDRDFRPAAPTRARWQRVWLAEHGGTLLPPISVVAVRRRLRDPRRPSPGLRGQGARRPHDRRDRLRLTARAR